MADAREVASQILDAGASLADTIGMANTGTTKVALTVASTVARIAARLVGKLGTKAALEALKELQRRVDAGEGIITTDELDADDAEVSDKIAELFRG